MGAALATVYTPSMAESQLRRNELTGEWVSFSPARSGRPKDWSRGRDGPQTSPHRDVDCPFCPGNEDQLPDIVLEMPAPDRRGWQTRVVPNKFPALSPEGNTERTTDGFHLSMDSFGRHEVIIECPDHDAEIPGMTPAQVETIIETYHRRYRDAMRQHANLLAVIFRNHGKLAGASLAHPHSQIIVTGIVPRRIREREEHAEAYYDQWGRCVLCDMIRHELEEDTRVVQSNDAFVTFVPYAAAVPFELWIAPLRHMADFGQVRDDDKSHLAHALRRALARLSDDLGHPDYNYVIHTAAQHRADEPQLHWYLQIQPRLTIRAGFEIGSGIRINPTLPEDNARDLRRADS